MRYKVIVRNAAKADFEKIYDYLKGGFGKKAAGKFKTSYIKIIKALRHTPRMYPAVPEIAGVHKCAALSPTLVLYQVFESERRVEILALYDGRNEHD